jgi:hypothetical protein
MHEHMTHYAHVQQQLTNIINIHAFTNNINIITNQQLYTLSHNSSKGENPPYNDKHHIQHLSIIHTSSYNHIKLVTKDLHDIRS